MKSLNTSIYSILIANLIFIQFLWPKIKNWIAKTGEQPSLQSFDPQEKRLAEAIIYLKEQKRKAKANE